MQTLKNFIVIEGIDGSGKSTLAKNLVNKLNDLYIKSIYTFEPTESEIGKVIRDYLKGKINITDESLMYLFAADRENHLNEITRLCNKGIKVICDRYIWSSIAYQGIFAGVDNVIDLNKNFVLPELVLYIDLEPEKAMARLVKNRSRLEVFEEFGKLSTIYNNYKLGLDYFINSFDLNCYKIYGDRCEEQLTDNCLDVILHLED